MFRRSFFAAFKAASIAVLKPNFQIKPIATMAVGDADQLLGFISYSSGAVSYASSDTSKATIVASGGNYYLHIIAAGDFTVTGSQVSSGLYLSASNTKNGSIVASGTVSDITYSTLALGKAATANGTSFNVADSTGYSLKKYLMVSGSAVYQQTLPSTAITTAQGVQAKIYAGGLGTMPDSPLIDIDSSFALCHINKFKNIGGSSTLDNNTGQFFPYNSYCDSGSITVTKIAIGVYQVAFMAAESPGYASFAAWDHRDLPAGLWNFSADLTLISGGPNVWVGVQLDTSGASYQEVVLTGTPQRVNFGTINNNTDDASHFQFVLCGAEGAATPATVTFTIANRTLTPGSASASASPVINDPILNLDNQYLANGVASDLSWVLYNTCFAADISAGLGNSLVSIGASLNNYPMTAMYAMKVISGEGNNALMYSDDGSQAIYLAEGLIQYGGSMFTGIGQSSYVIADGNWLILTFTTNSANLLADIFINGFKVSRNYNSSSLFAFVDLYLLGNANNSFKNKMNMSGVTIWNTQLSDADIYTATGIMKERMRLKNHFMPISLTDNCFYVDEGDSITAVPLGTPAYQQLYRANYTPQLFGFSAAINGAKLGNSGDLDSSSVNTMWGRQTWVLSSIENAIANGYNVGMSILIGTNDIGGWSTTAQVDAYYANLVSYVATMRGAGAKVAMSTMLDLNNAGFGVTTDKTLLLYFNSLIVAGNGINCDAVIDYHSNAAFTTATTTYYNSDLVHPNPTGQGVMGTIIKPVMDGLFGL